MNTTENPSTMESTSPNQLIVRYGVIGGLIAIAYGLLGIITGFSSPANGIGGMVLNGVLALAIYCVIMVFAVRDHRNKNLGGIISFGQGFKVAFLTGLIIAVISTIFNYLYFNFIDPDFLASMTADMEVFYEKMNMTEEQIDKAMSQMENSFTLMGLLRTFGIGAAMGLIPSLIIAAVMKKSPPEVAV